MSMFEYLMNLLLDDKSLIEKNYQLYNVANILKGVREVERTIFAYGEGHKIKLEVIL